MIVALIALAAAQQAPCREAFGQVACGWDCQAAFGQVVCGDWPGAACKATGGQITCGPPPPPDWEHRFGLHPPQAECVAVNGQVSCGYDCAQNDTHAGCARAPGGNCSLSGDGILCVDEPVIAAQTHRSTASHGDPTTCLSRRGVTACGYDCAATDTEVACADWWGGTCFVHEGSVVCGPAAPKRDHEAPRAECITSQAGIACGWGCVATDFRVACSQIPGGQCRKDDKEVYCAP